MSDGLELASSARSAERSSGRPLGAPDAERTTAMSEPIVVQEP